MDKVKIQDVKTGAIKEVKKVLASDYIATGKFRLYEEKEEQKKVVFPKINSKED